MMHVRRAIKAVHGCMTLLNKQYYDLDAYVTGKSEHRTCIVCLHLILCMIYVFSFEKNL